MLIPPISALEFGFGQHVWNINIATVIEDIKKFVQVCSRGPLSQAS
jgi:hypothetical protein